MDTPRRILVPLDGSELAAAGLDHAVELARALGAHLVLFTAVAGEEKAALEQFARFEGISLDEAADAHLDRLAAAVPDDVPVERHHGHGPTPAGSIVDHVAQHDISMIVMASHGRSGVGRWLLGSTADKVLQSSPVPVLVVPVRSRATAPGA